MRFRNAKCLLLKGLRVVVAPLRKQSCLLGYQGESVEVHLRYDLRGLKIYGLGAGVLTGKVFLRFSALLGHVQGIQTHVIFLKLFTAVIRPE